MKGPGTGVTLYVAGWLALGTLVAAALLFVLRGSDDGQDALPPVRHTQLSVAAQQAGCELRAGARHRPGEPPVAGGRARPAAARFYESAPSERALVGALRRGVVVISYRPDVPPQQRELLRALQRVLPRGTIVAPNDRMPYAIAVTAWHRLLGCRRIGPQTLDALRLFRGRFVGAGPDSPG